MKNHLMLPMALAATLAIAACSSGGTNETRATTYTPPPPATDPAAPAALPPGNPAPVTSDQLPPLDPGV